MTEGDGMTSRAMQSEQIGELAAALAKAQKAIKPPKKDRTAEIKSDKGRYSYAYSDLSSLIEAIRDPLADNELAYAQTIEQDGDWIRLITKLLHSSGQWLGSEYPIHRFQRPQEQGSAITYARRYSLGALVGVAAEDDDGAAAQSGKVVEREATPERKPRAQTTGAAPKDDPNLRKEVEALILQTEELTGMARDRVCQGASMYFPTGHPRAGEQPTYEERWEDGASVPGVKHSIAAGTIHTKVLPIAKAALLERRKRFEAEQLGQGVAEDVEEALGQDEPALFDEQDAIA